MYIDTHAHHKSNFTQVLVGTHTLAVHPWELVMPFSRDEFDKKWQSLKVSNTNAIAIGECGLDRVHEKIATIDDQVYVLMKHLELAQERELPVIIHCVRAYSDLLHILKRAKLKKPVILHAFGGNAHEMGELLKYDTYFSYGARLFKNDQMIKITPPERILLETGDQTEKSIKDIYKKAAESLNKEEDVLEEELYQNFLRCFNQLDHVSAANFIDDLNRRKEL